MSVSKKIKTQMALASCTTLGVGGNADFFLDASNPDEVRDGVLWAKSEELSITCIGGGSNVLVADAGVRGLVLRQTYADMILTDVGDTVRVVVAAGCLFDTCIKKLVDLGIWGLENLSGIPGFMGATPVQNVGAYGVEVSDVIESVEAYDCLTDTFVTLNKEECRFAYRDSLFKHPEGKRYIITSVTCLLSRVPKPQLGYNDLERYMKDVPHPSLQHIRTAILSIRSRKFPDWNQIGTAGSFFKNPIITKMAFQALRRIHADIPGFEIGADAIKIPFGYVLDKIFNLKGVHDNHVGLYAEQALVLVCDREATASEITMFASKIIDRATRELNLSVEQEVTVLS